MKKTLLFFSLLVAPLFSASHLMIGAGAFDVDKPHPQAMLQLEYRWDVHYRRIRPLAGLFVAAQGNSYVFGGVGIDIFFLKKVVLTPSFAPGVYYHAGGKHLGFPINFRSAVDLSYVCHNQGRIGAQFSHISNAGMLWKNPGADSLVFFYAIPL
jgi:hypothetical protein